MQALFDEINKIMLNLYRASAGSGKTYTISQKFIELATKDVNYFKRVLAVTFTNKAAEEMKMRIIENLASSGDQQLQFILSHILHNYSRFNISTIDSFVQRIIKSVAFEIKIPTSYELELDTQIVADVLVDKILLKSNENEQIRNWLTKLAFHKIDSDKKWDFRTELKDFALQLFKEKFYYLLQQIDNQDINKAVTTLLEDTNNLIKKYKEVIVPLLKKGQQLSDSSVFDRGNIKFLKRFFIENDKPYPTLDIKKSLIPFIDGSWEDKKTYKANAGEIRPLVNLLNEILAIKEQYGKDFISAKNIQQNIFYFYLIFELFNLLSEYRSEYNTLIISDLTVLLRNLIGDENNDAPFIYEKIGNRLNHIMIDEFQDTSEFQWLNFKPLVENSLSENYFNMIVGDAKQSIYRWRNSDWRLIGFKLKETFPNLNEINLDTNWRSKKNIVLFNNTIFSLLPQILQDRINKDIEGITELEKYRSIIPDLYGDVKQKIAEHNKHGGYVRLTFDKTRLDSESKYYRIADLINELLDIYDPKDIGILVRTNKEGSDVVQSLLLYQNTCEDCHHYDIISSESLLLAIFPAIRLIETALYFAQNPQEIYFAKILAYYYQKNINTQLADNQLFEIDDLNEILKLLPTEFATTKDELSKMNIYDLTQKIIRDFSLNLDSANIPYLRTFEEFTNDFLVRYQSDLNEFLKYWESKKDNLSVTTNDTGNAIQVMTIHKSKGLAFTVVVMPTLDWSLSTSRGILWAETKGTPYEKYSPILPISNTKELLESHFALQHLEEKVFSYVDTLNVLYVAMTRAKEAIFAFGNITKTLTGSKITDNLFNSVKKSESLSDELTVNLNEFLTGEDDALIMEFGELREEKIASKEISRKDILIKKYKNEEWNKKIGIVSHNERFFAARFEKRRNAIKEGIQMHHIFEKIKYYDEIDKRLEDFILTGDLSLDDAKKLKKHIEVLFKNEQIKSLFDRRYEVIVEKEIMTRDGQIFIPDRILIGENQIIVVDYKFGEKRSSHKKQIKNYKKILHEIYQKEVKGILLYFNLEEIVEI